MKIANLVAITKFLFRMIEWHLYGQASSVVGHKCLGSNPEIARSLFTFIGHKVDVKQQYFL